MFRFQLSDKNAHTRNKYAETASKRKENKLPHRVRCKRKTMKLTNVFGRTKESALKADEYDPICVWDRLSP